jgi:heme-degrading monooxygenase HmoA
MIAKVIDVQIKPGHTDAFHESQEIWNRESRLTDGYSGEYVAPISTARALVVAFWESRDAYDRWMAAEHDRIAALAGSDEHYEALTITIVDGAQPSRPV